METKRQNKQTKTMQELTQLNRWKKFIVKLKEIEYDFRKQEDNYRLTESLL